MAMQEEKYVEKSCYCNWNCTKRGFVPGGKNMWKFEIFQEGELYLVSKKSKDGLLGIIRNVYFQ